MSIQLLPEEKETKIIFNEQDEHAYVWTLEKKVAERFEKAGFEVISHDEKTGEFKLKGDKMSILRAIRKPVERTAAQKVASKRNFEKMQQKLQQKIEDQN